MKVCTKCAQSKPLDAFTNKRNGKYGKQSACKPCVNEYSRARAAAKIEELDPSSFPETKVCTICGEDKPLGQFNKQRLGRYGLRADCKPCAATRAKRWAQENPDYAREYRKANAERFNEYQRQWRARQDPDVLRSKERRRYVEDPEKHRLRANEWRSKNLERARELDRQKYQRNRDALLAKNAAWREANPEYAREWRARNPQSMGEVQRRRRAQKRATQVLKFSVAELNQRMSYYGLRCWMCRVGEFEEVDHVKPLSAGGPHILANLRPACSKCNRSKGAKWPLAVINDSNTNQGEIA